MKFTLNSLCLFLLLSTSVFSAQMPKEDIKRINYAIKNAMGDYYSFLALEITQAEKNNTTGLITELGIGTKLFSVHQLSAGVRFDKDITYLFVDYKQQEQEGFLNTQYELEGFLPNFQGQTSLLLVNGEDDPISLRYEFDFKSNVILVTAYQIALTRFINKVIEEEQINLDELHSLLLKLKGKYLIPWN